MNESAQPNKVVSLTYGEILKRQAMALAIVIPVLYLPLIWLTFDLKISPYSGVLVLSPAFAICRLVQVPFVGVVICIGFLVFAQIIVSFCLTRSRVWLFSVCMVLAAISTESSREIYLRSKPVVGDGLRSIVVEGVVLTNIVFGKM